MRVHLTEVIPMSETHSKQLSDGNQAVFTMKHSLIERRELHFRCRRVNDMMCIVALFGLILMIIDTECRLNQIPENRIFIIRPLISISSLALVSLVLYYHALDVRLYAINNHIADWRITLKIRGIMMVTCEIIICTIHPFPYLTKPSSSEGDRSWLDMALTLPSKSFVFCCFFC
jgi:hypothetical protein